MGRARRNRAIQRMASSGSTSGRPANGVPGRGLRKLTGTSWGSTARSWPSSSRRCSTLSPMPSSTPQHSSMPSFLTSWQVSKRSAHEWVVTTSREERLRRLQVVVVAVHPAVGEAPRLLRGEHPGAHGHVEAGLVLHQRHELEHPLHGALVGAADGQHDAELARAERRRLPCRSQHVVGLEEGGGLHGRLELGRLAAEVAVLGAAAGLGRQDPLDLDGVAAPREAHLVGQGGQRRHRRIGHVGEGGQLGGAQHPPLVEQRGLGGADGPAGVVGREAGPLGLGTDGGSRRGRRGRPAWAQRVVAARVGSRRTRTATDDGSLRPP